MRISGVIGVALCVAFTITGCVSAPIESIVSGEKMEGWKVGSQHDFGRGRGSIREFLPADESINQWRHLATIQFLEGARNSPRAAMDDLERTMNARCPGKTDWSIVSDDPHSVVYEWRIHGCPGQDNQSEIARMMQGNDGLHRIAYSEKGDSMDPANRALWLHTLQTAYVAKGDPQHPIVLTAK